MQSQILRPSLQWRCLLLVLMAIPVAASPEEGTILKNWSFNMTYIPSELASWRDNNFPDPCNINANWKGVFCKGSNNVLSIDLHATQIGGPLVPELGQLSNLTHLNLDVNKFFGPIPQEFGNLSALTNMNLSSNNLTGSIPASLGKLTKLEYLNLDNNFFSGPIPQEFGNLSSLTNLSLLKNNLIGSIPTSLGKLTKLKSLNLDNNFFSGPIPQEFGNLSSLTNLSLLKNNLSGSIPTSLGKLTKLEYLNFGLNKFSGPIPQEFGNLSALIFLSLFGNLLDSSIPTSLGKLIKLEYLNLGDNAINGVVPQEFGDLSALTSLSLNKNRLSGTILFTNSHDNKLRSLDMSSNNFSGPYPKSFASFAFLFDIRLDSNNISGVLNISQILEILNIAGVQNNLSFVNQSVSLMNNSITDVINDTVGNFQIPSTIGLRLLANPYCDGSTNLYDDLKRCLCHQDLFCYFSNSSRPPSLGISPSSGSNTNSNGIIIGIICGIVFLLAIFVGVIIKCKFFKLEGVRNTCGKQIKSLLVLPLENMDARFSDALSIINDVKALDEHSFCINTHQCMRLVGFYMKVGEFFESAKKACKDFPIGEATLSLDATLSVLQKGQVLLTKYTKDDWHTIVMTEGVNQGSFDAIHLELEACIQTISEFLEEKVPEIKLLPFMQWGCLGTSLSLQSKEHDLTTIFGRDVDKDKKDMLAKVKSTILKTNNTRSLTDEERSLKIFALDIASASLQDEKPPPIATTKFEELPTVLRINPLHIELGEPLGSGGSAKVLKCRWSDVDCAVKILQHGDVNGLRAEVGKLMELRHPNIVTLFGFSVGEGDLEGHPMVVMELLNGDLRLLLRDGPLRLNKAVDVMHKIATGMKYLHSRGVFHGDLKSMNVLVKDLTGLFEVKITDFGVSQQIFEYVDHDSTNDAINTKTFNNRVGTSMWMAPEVLTSSGDGNMYSAKADVYSFAMVCVEILTGKMPYSKSLEKIKDVRQYVVDEDKRPEQPLSLPNDLRELIVQCWDKDPERRPDFHQICTRLQNLQAYSQALHKRQWKFALCS